MNRTLNQLITITHVAPLDGRVARITFSDGVVRNVDLTPYLTGRVFAPVRFSTTIFRRMRVRNGSICWPGGADLDPLVLYGSRIPARWDAAARTTERMR